MAGFSFWEVTATLTTRGSGERSALGRTFVNTLLQGSCQARRQPEKGTPDQVFAGIERNAQVDGRRADYPGE